MVTGEGRWTFSLLSYFRISPKSKWLWAWSTCHQHEMTTTKTRNCIVTQCKSYHRRLRPTGYSCLLLHEVFLHCSPFKSFCTPAFLNVFLLLILFKKRKKKLSIHSSSACELGSVHLNTESSECLENDIKQCFYSFLLLLFISYLENIFE